MRTIPSLILVSLAAVQAPKAPSALAATSATKSVVVLSWTAGDPATTRYAVDRKPLGSPWTPAPGAKAPPPVVTTPVDGVTFTDSTIDPFTTYVYRVRGMNAANAASGPSNEITVGPPPTGFSQVLTEPAGLASGYFAAGIHMTLDGNGDPAVAYLFLDPDKNGDYADTTLHVVTWNRARYRWNTPALVGTIGTVDGNHARYGLSLAYDASTQRFGLAHPVGTTEVRIAFSEDGVTWRDVSVEKTPDESTLGPPSLALDKGQVYLAYDDRSHNLRYRTGQQSDPPSKWKAQHSPLLPGTFEIRPYAASVAVDAAGRPAVAYWINPDEGYNTTLAFWRPGEGTAVKITDTNGEQSDRVDANLAFAGTQAVVAIYARRDAEYFAGRHQIWFARSLDGGKTWAPATPLPNDGNNNMDAPVAIAVNGRGIPALTAPVNGGNDDGRRCGQPKLMRESAAAWTICAPNTTGTPTGYAGTPQLLFAANDKLYVVFSTYAAGGGLKTGVVLWREP